MNLIRDTITWRAKHPGQQRQDAIDNKSARGHQRNDDPGALTAAADGGDGSACGHQSNDDPGAFQPSPSSAERENDCLPASKVINFYPILDILYPNSDLNHNHIFLFVVAVDVHNRCR